MESAGDKYCLEVPIKRCKKCSQKQGSTPFFSAMNESLRNAFADLHYEEQEIITSNDKVVSVFDREW